MISHGAKTLPAIIARMLASFCAAVAPITTGWPIGWPACAIFVHQPSWRPSAA
jgi:hypothetical protein